MTTPAKALPALAALTLPLALSLTGCNRNTDPGNDREAQLEPPPKAVPVESASAALANVATAIIKPETMTSADIGALGGMIGMGLIGLFLGSVILAVGYRLLWAWVDQENTRSEV